MDITDGLDKMSRTCVAQVVDACIDGAVSDEMSTIKAALYDGEDFELLFTSEAADQERLLTLWAEAFKEPLWQLGVITEEKCGLQIRWTDREEAIEVHGNQHYRSTE